MENVNDDVLDVFGAMALLKLGRNAVYDGCARGEIPHRRIGKLLRFSRSGLLRWLHSTDDTPSAANDNAGGKRNRTPFRAGASCLG